MNFTRNPWGNEDKEKERGRKVVETMTGDTYSSIIG